MTQKEIIPHLPRLIIHVRKEYFDQIRSGEKNEEYRKMNQYWFRRLCGPTGCGIIYDAVLIASGYPEKTALDKWLMFDYAGFSMPKIRHKEFGPDPVQVYAIQLDPKNRRDVPTFA